MQILNRHPLFTYLLIGAAALITYIPFLGAAPLFDWDEINFAESAREMIVSGNYFQVQINFEPFWEKPPLFIWMQVASMKLFGINAFAARLPNAIIGAFTLITLFRVGNWLKSRRLGWIVAGFYFISLLPAVYFKSGIIDPTFNLFIFLGLVQILKFEVGDQAKFAPLWAGFWIGLATLTKGPVALLVLGLVYLIWKLAIHRKPLPWKALFQFTGIYLLVILSWFGSIILFAPDGLTTVTKFITYQAELFSQAVAGHEQPFFYHFIVFLLGCFPLSAFAFRGMAIKGLPDREKMTRQLMTVWFWVVLILFSIVRTKIVHYSSMLYFPGAVLAGLYLDHLWGGAGELVASGHIEPVASGHRAIDHATEPALSLPNGAQSAHSPKPKWDTYAIYTLGLILFATLTLSINLIAHNQPYLQSKSTNPFMRAALGANIPWTGYEFLPGLLFAAAGIAGLYLLAKARYKAFLLTFALTMPLFLNSLNALVVPRIADYSQNAAIDFFREKAREDAYLMVEGYKSYAHYFYGEVKPFPHPEVPLEERGLWMANGPIDKPVYMVSRVDKADAQFESWFGHFKRMDEKNGFVFYRREIPTQQ